MAEWVSPSHLGPGLTAILQCWVWSVPMLSLFMSLVTSAEVSVCGRRWLAGDFAGQGDPELMKITIHVPHNTGVCIAKWDVLLSA